MGSIYRIVNAGNEFRVNLANYYAQEETRESGNKKEAALSSLANFQRSLGNSVRMEQAGDQYNDQINELAGRLDARNTLNINTSLAAAQQLGGIAAQAAAAGVGGSSIDALDGVTELQRNITQQGTTLNTKQMASSGTRSAVDNLTNGLQAVDFGATFGSYDYNKDVKPVPLKNRITTIAAIAVATYFGGPAAGQAAADSTLAAWDASNGKYNSAYKQADKASGEWLSAAKDYAQRGGQSWWGAVTQSGGTNGGNPSSSLSGYSDQPSSDSSGGDFSMWGW